MNAPTKPDIRPANPRFSSGPCCKPPGWSLEQLGYAFVGRSHRHATGKALLKEVITRTRAVLEIPDSHIIGIVPAEGYVLGDHVGGVGIDPEMAEGEIQRGAGHRRSPPFSWARRGPRRCDRGR